MPGSPAVDLRGIRKTYDATVALDAASWHAPTATITAVLGRNGAGKTTSIGICTGRLRPDAGIARVLDRDPRRDARALRSRVGVMPQAAGSGAAGVYPSARVGEVLQLFASFAANPLNVEALLDRLDLVAHRRATWRSLSGGEQQRLSLALAIVARPELVFLDEPTAGLDVHARLRVWDLLGELRSAGVTVVLTTHMMEEAERLADHVVVLERGHVAAQGALADIAGGDLAQLSFDATAALPLDDLTRRLPPGAAVREQPPGHYVVDGVVDPSVVATVTAWCADHDALPQRLETGRRRLEDVFLDLTRTET